VPLGVIRADARPIPERVWGGLNGAWYAHHAANHRW